MRYVIIGGVAAGASAAARLRRLDEKAEIVLLEKGKTISYANCGLPYHVGGVIADRARLTVMPTAKFAAWFNIEIRTETEATSIDRAAKKVTIKTAAGEETLGYDKLLLATGATPIGDAYSDETHPHVAHLWTLADMDRVISKLGKAKRVIVVGAGFIGLELAESLRHKGLEVTIVQRGEHVLPTLDAEMAGPLATELRDLGVDIRFGRMVADFEEKSDGVIAVLNNGERLETDLAVVSTGVKPRSDLARACGLTLGSKGHIVVDENLLTSDPTFMRRETSLKSSIPFSADKRQSLSPVPPISRDVSPLTIWPAGKASTAALSVRVSSKSASLPRQESAGRKAALRAKVARIRKFTFIRHPPRATIPAPSASR